MPTVKAAVVHKSNDPFQIEELTLGDPRDDEVLVRVVSSGLCHTDLICRDQWFPVPLPSVFGHEGAGVVEAVGKNVSKVQPGDHVVMSVMSCGTCPTCAVGKPTYCHSAFPLNFGGGRLDGSSALSANGTVVHSHFFGQSSLASHSIAYERNVVKVDPEVDLRLLGPLGCGIQTGFGGVVNSLRPEAGSSIALFGVGSVGLAAVMGAHLAGCATIIAVDLKDSRLEKARSLGATHMINAGTVDNVGEAIQDITGGGANYSLEMTANPAVFRTAVECLAPLGTCGLIGASALGTEVTFDMNSILIGGRTVRGLLEGDSVLDVFIPKMVEFVKQGRLPLADIVSFYGLDQINEAAADAESGAAIKPVFTFSGS
jgi:aryl-alcohol dehydrogenase